MKEVLHAKAKELVGLLDKIMDTTNYDGLVVTDGLDEKIAAEASDNFGTKVLKVKYKNNLNGRKDEREIRWEATRKSQDNKYIIDSYEITKGARNFERDLKHDHIHLMDANCGLVYYISGRESIEHLDSTRELWAVVKLLKCAVVLANDTMQKVMTPMPKFKDISKEALTKELDI